MVKKLHLFFAAYYNHSTGTEYKKAHGVSRQNFHGDGFNGLVFEIFNVQGSL